MSLGLPLTACPKVAEYSNENPFSQSRLRASIHAPSSPPLAPEAHAPKVSIHIPAYREPPEMLKATLDAVANLFLGRELMTRWGTLDDYAMEKAARDVFHRLNPNFKNIRVPVRSLSGGQRQVVAISRALYFNAKALIMDEPCAALGPEETRMVHNLVRKLKAQGVGIFLISHDMPDVFGLSDRLSVMKNGKTVGTYRTAEVTEDEVLGMIIAGKKVTRVPEAFAPA